MKKNFVLLMAVLLMASCSEQSLIDDYVTEVQSVEKQQETPMANLYESNITKARWGDANAYIQLAKCYHDGIGVKADFMGTVTMLMMADQFGEKKGMDKFLDSLPDDDNMKMTFKAIEQLDRRGYARGDSIADILISNGFSDGYSIRGILQVEQGDTLGGYQSIQEGVERGSTFGQLLLCAFPTKGEQTDNVFKLEMMKEYADVIPLAGMLIGDIYSGYDDGKVVDAGLAAQYYQKADRLGVLGRRQARWLLGYYEREGIQVDAQEIERLNTIAGYKLADRKIEYSHEAQCDSVCTDSICAMD